ncbi:MAG: hypothetical protein AAF533_17785 [Acidobacteriota bacterium]
MTRTRTLALALVTCLPLLAHAYVQPRQLPSMAQRLGLRPLERVHPTTMGPLTASQEASLQRLADRQGAQWKARFDQRTGRVSLASGSGVPWLPGWGNDLTWRQLGFDAAPDRDKTLDMLDERARALMTEHPELFGLEEADATLVRGLSSSLQDGRLWFLNYLVEREGVPVLDALVTFRVSSGNLVQLGTALVDDALALAPTAPLLTAEDALSGLLTDLAPLAKDDTPLVPTEVVDDGTLVLLPWEGSDGLEYRLAWKVALRLPGGVETWQSYRDAVTGEALAFEDANNYACPTPAIPQGRVRGGVIIGPLEEVSEVVRGMPWVDIENDGPINADYNGIFTRDPAFPASTSLSGPWFDMECADCVNPPQVFREDAFGDLNLGMGGLNGDGNGFSSRPERNAYYHLNVVRQVASKHLDDAAVDGFFTSNIVATVMAPGSCNAVWTGTQMLFFPMDDTCNNTADISDIVQHEWGHGLDQFTNSGMIPDGARSEGLSDIVAWISSHDAGSGRYFFLGDGNFLRTALSDEDPQGLKTVGNVDGICGGQPHCTGGVISQAFWDLGVELRGKYGDSAGWFVLERLFFQSLPISSSFLPDRPDSVYDAVVLIDDDNGDLMDGVPNGEAINAAFGLHGMTSTPEVADSDECTPLAAPDLTLVKLTDPDTLQPQVMVSWPDVPGAVMYDLYRIDSERDTASAPIATLFPPATDFIDVSVIDGITYEYLIRVFDATGCFSIDETLTPITVDPLSEFDLDPLVPDDSIRPENNVNGLAEPGELIDVPLTVLNIGADATATFATVTSPTPGVVVVSDRADVGDIPAGGSASSAGTHVRLQLAGEPTIECGQTIQLDFLVESDEGCTRVTRFMEIGESGIANYFLEELEAGDAGWTVDPEGSDDAAAGNWEHAVPMGWGPDIFGQVYEDYTPDPGQSCWLTGNIGAAMNSVVDGCTTLETTDFDLDMRTGLVLSYARAFSRWFDSTDTMVVEYSVDSGGAWAELETVDEMTGGWDFVSFELDDILGGPEATLRLRFRVCGSPATGTFMDATEAAVDQIDIGERFLNCMAVEPPDGTPSLTLVALTGDNVGDDAMDGGIGNGNGIVEPGETVKLLLDVENLGLAAATSVTGLLEIVDAPAGVVIADSNTTWVDIDPGTIERSGADVDPHVELVIPRPGVDCDGSITCRLTLDYEDAGGMTYQTMREFTLDIGLPGGTVPKNVLFFDDFEGLSDGWTSGATAGEDDWDIGGIGLSGPQSPTDPGRADGGARVRGTDLGGGRAPGDPGNYEAGASTWLESPGIDCTACERVYLDFRRFLSVAGGDRAQVLALDGSGTWVVVWDNADAAVSDGDWTDQLVDLGAAAVGNADLRVRFELESRGGGGLGGWTLDDVRVFEAGNTCSGAEGCESLPWPLPAGEVLRATGLASSSSVEFSWDAATPTPGEHFRLYRGTDPTMLGDLVTPADLTATRFEDAAAPGTIYFYRLRLADCDGVEGP